MEFATSGSEINYDKDFPKLRRLRLPIRDDEDERGRMLVNAFVQDGSVCSSLREYDFGEYPLTAEFMGRLGSVFPNARNVHWSQFFRNS